jgi:hypothetical protein
VRSLKAQNAGWLWSVAVLDVILLFLIQGGSASVSRPWQVAQELGLRGAATAAAPVIVLILTGILPAEVKAMLVYWRVRDVLPSHRAFTLHAVRDSRIDLATLRKNVGEFPTAPRDQSSRWYQLYKAVGTDVIVSNSHRHFLLFRDLAALSFVLIFAAPAVLWFIDRPLVSPAALIFGAQYLLSAIAARHEGVRLVNNVLALHSAKKRR